jgi:hypothetical protein
MTRNALTVIPTATRLILIQYPECWVLVLSIAAWCVLIAADAGSVLPLACAMHEPMASSGAVARTVTAAAVQCTLMLSAMMLPVQLENLRGVAARSFWSRRHRAMALVIVGYMAPWLVFGLTLGFAFRLQTETKFLAHVPLVSIALLTAAAWQLTRFKRRSLVRCDRDAILAPSGWMADASCLRHGSLLAADCGGSCWALMLVCAASEHAFWASTLITILLWGERFLRTPRLGLSAAVLAAAAVLHPFLFR